MKVILEKIIKNKLAQLILCDDNITVNVVYDGEVIDSSGGGTWDNIKNTDLVCEYLTLIVEDYIERKEEHLAFMAILEEEGWE